MPPSFGVKYPFALKLFPNYNYFLQTVALKALHAIATINPASRLLRWGHLINTSGYPPLPLLCNLSHLGHLSLYLRTHLRRHLRTPAYLPRTPEASPKFCKWLPSPRSPRYNNLSILLHCCFNLRPIIVFIFPFFRHHF